jgi:5-(aminomethyl)-3-furanmethanol phosphate kinase
MPGAVDIVVKVGGALLGHLARLDDALAAIGAAAAARRLLVVPGGGPFADAVRDADRRVQLSDEAAHWMAILAMDQYAHLLAARIAGSVLVDDPDQIAAAGGIDRSRRPGTVPILAPYRWLRRADPLPHSWSVTSDSIAAWVAGQLGAQTLVLVKPPEFEGQEPRRVDAHFARALPAAVNAVIVPADRLDRLTQALRT